MLHFLPRKKESLVVIFITKNKSFFLPFVISNQNYLCYSIEVSRFVKCLTFQWSVLHLLPWVRGQYFARRPLLSARLLKRSRMFHPVRSIRLPMPMPHWLLRNEMRKGAESFHNVICIKSILFRKISFF